MNIILDSIVQETNLTTTENGGVTRESSNSAVLDLFSLGGAYRNRTDNDIIHLFNAALEEDSDLALKCLFYLRDIRGGQGERRFFRCAYRWLCTAHPRIAEINLGFIPAFGRWDDLIYITIDTPIENAAFEIIKNQLYNDIHSLTPSLLAKWMPSQNASSLETKRIGIKLAKYLGLSSKNYRQMLSDLRKRINVLEKLLSDNKWDEIQFDKIPSRAGLIYRNAFNRHCQQKYVDFLKDKNANINAKTLYPYDIAHQALKLGYKNYNDPERVAMQKYWDNLPDFYNGHPENSIAIVDTSGSMWGRPLEAAISLGAYVADKSTGPFANHFITFSNRPKLIKFQGFDIVDKFAHCQQSNWGYNTDIKAVFDLLLSKAKTEKVKAEDMPSRLYIFSDMEFDACLNFNSIPVSFYDDVYSDLELIEKEWAAAGYELPQVIFWNLDARENRIPAIGNKFSYVSGLSPVMIHTILGGKTGYDLMIEKLIESGRYDLIHS